MTEEFGLGVDPGVRATGLTIVGHRASVWRVLASITVYTTNKRDLVSRLKMISTALDVLRPRPILSWMAVEDPTHVITYKQRKGETNFDALRVLMVVGVALEHAFERGISVVLVEPGELKMSVGASRTAEKQEVVTAVRAVVRDCPADMSEHAAEAAAAAIAGERQIHFKNVVHRARETRQ